MKNIRRLRSQPISIRLVTINLQLPIFIMVFIRVVLLFYNLLEVQLVRLLSDLLSIHIVVTIFIRLNFLRSIQVVLVIYFVFVVLSGSIVGKLALEVYVFDWVILHGHIVIDHFSSQVTSKAVHLHTIWPHAIQIIIIMVALLGNSHLRKFASAVHYFFHLFFIVVITLLWWSFVYNRVWAQTFTISDIMANIWRYKTILFKLCLQRFFLVLGEWWVEVLFGHGSQIDFVKWIQCSIIWNIKINRRYTLAHLQKSASIMLSLVLGRQIKESHLALIKRWVNGSRIKQIILITLSNFVLVFSCFCALGLEQMTGYWRYRAVGGTSLWYLLHFYNGTSSNRMCLHPNLLNSDFILVYFDHVVDKIIVYQILPCLFWDICVFLRGDYYFVFVVATMSISVIQNVSMKLISLDLFKKLWYNRSIVYV